LINACKRALDFKIYSFKTVQKILENNLDQMIGKRRKEQELPDHGNIRGKQYYH
jgi:hypothetical protein